MLSVCTYDRCLCGLPTLQDGYENFFCAVDLHAITVPQDPKVSMCGISGIMYFEVCMVRAKSGADIGCTSTLFGSYAPYVCIWKYEVCVQGQHMRHQCRSRMGARAESCCASISCTSALCESYAQCVCLYTSNVYNLALV